MLLFSHCALHFFSSIFVLAVVINIYDATERYILRHFQRNTLMLNMHSGIEKMVFDYGVCSTVSFILSGLETRSLGHSTICIT